MGVRVGLEGMVGVSMRAGEIKVRSEVEEEEGEE